MRVAFITRSTLHNVPGGDTVQILQTAKYLREYGIETDVCLTSNKIDYKKYDLLHFTNITRPSDILYHIKQAQKPFVLSPFLIDYSEYDRNYRQGLSGVILRRFSANMNEYAKTFGRWLNGRDVLRSKSYLWKGQRKSIREILKKAAMILPNSEAENKKLREVFEVEPDYSVVHFGVDPCLFSTDKEVTKDEKMVVCAARIEGLKNQLNLIKALNNTDYTLVIAGSPAPNQKKYYEKCRKVAAKNILFLDHMPHEELVKYYKKAKVHALPSWFETCGLASLEAAAAGCNVVITDKGYSREYFGDEAFYCDPGDMDSIYETIHQASEQPVGNKLQGKILKTYTWRQAAMDTKAAYKRVLPDID